MNRSLVTIVVSLVLLAAAVHGQSIQEHMSYNFLGGGARAEAMGSAYFALSDDITAGAWNPAGLTVHEGPILGFGYGSLAPRGYTDISLYQNIFRTNHAGSLNNVSGINFVAPFRVKGHAVVGSVNYTRNFDAYYGEGLSFIEYVPRFVFRNNIGQIEIFDAQAETRSEYLGGVASVTFSLGSRLYNNISWGLGINIYTGKTTAETVIGYQVDDLPIGLNEQLGTGRADYLNIDTSQYSGVNFTLGFRKAGEKLDAGLVIRTPFDLKRTQGLSLYQITSLNGLAIEEDTDTTFYDDLVTKYEMPFMVGIGIAYKPRADLILSMDAEYKGFSSSKVKSRDSLRIDPSGNNEEFYTEMDPEWNSTFGMRLGGEYMVNTGIGAIPIRAGLGFLPLPEPNKSDTKYPAMSYNFPHMVFLPFVKLFNKDTTPICYTYSLGTGIRWSQIFLEWAYTYSTLYRDFDQDRVAAESRNHHFGFTFTGYF